MVGAQVESPGAKRTQLTALPRAGHSWLMTLNLKAFFWGGGRGERREAPPR